MATATVLKTDEPKGLVSSTLTPSAMFNVIVNPELPPGTVLFMQGGQIVQIIKGIRGDANGEREDC